MPGRKSADLHGSVPDAALVALLLIDVINDLEFEGSADLVQYALPMAERLAALKRRARALGIPAIYANDNFGKWQSNFAALLERCLTADVQGRRIAELLRPESDDYFVLKPKHSAFFSTTLDTLLTYLGASTLILTGLTGNICVLMTAADAHMRDFRLIVPEDCIASIEPEHNRWALRHMASVFGADIAPSEALDLRALVGQCQAEGRKTAAAGA
jgi:nicotinamidase-related amidase